MVMWSNVSSTIVLIVAAISLALAWALWVAASRTGQRKVRYIAAAFFIHFVKSAFVAYAIYTRSVEHEIVELIEGGFDLLMVILVALPFLARS